MSKYGFWISGASPASSATMFHATSVANANKHNKSRQLPREGVFERQQYTDPAALRPQWLFLMSVPSH